MNPNPTRLYDIGREIVSETLPDRRTEWTQHIASLAVAEDTLAVVQAKAEAVIIEAAGGEKALGSNAESRKRSMIIALNDDLPYIMALDTARVLRRQVRESDMLVKNERDHLALIRAALYACAGYAVEVEG